jgi:dTDP-4-amino-4,6-dideoxygalactose transaminase
MSFEVVNKFEKKIASFFGSPHAVATDCCTHALELCLRYTEASSISVPHHTYISVPFLASKLSIDLMWKDEEWVDYYYLTDRVIDAAVLWEPRSYVEGTLMCVSFQFQKHLSLGRGGIILMDDPRAQAILKKMSYDGRESTLPWREQNISSVGYHYYMTPEVAQMGLDKLPNAVDTNPRQWKMSDWPNLREMGVFQ